MNKENTDINWHDSEIISIVMETKENLSTLVLKIKRVDGRSLLCSFRDVVYLKMTGVNTQNIIFDAFKISTKEAAQELLKENFDYLSLEQVEEASEKIAKKEWACFEVQPSVGAEIKVVSKSQILETDVQNS